MRKRKLGFSAVIFITIIAIFGCFLDLRISAAPNEYKFDFGAGPVEPGYIGVSASTAYSKSRGYGFNTPWNMRDVAASGSGLTSDAVQFLTYGTKSENTFNVDLDNGLYEVKVTLGNTSRASVAAEGVYQIINMTGNCATDKFQIPITDGQLNILVTAGKEGTPFTLSALGIRKISDVPVTNRTIYIGGDSTVCNYYPLDTSAQAGWGQMLHKFVDTNVFQIRNMASSGQFGNNVIRATAIASDGGPNVDYLKVFSANAFQPVSEEKITIYIAGDSTVQTYNASYAPQAGWGQFLGQYFTSNVVIENRAIAGRSSRSFVEEGRLDSILSVIKPGDYLFIQFGHNDADISKPERYSAPYTTYKEYLRKYVDGARQKGAIPVLITPVARLNYKNNAFVNDFPDYCTAMKQVAEEKNVKLIDLMTKSLNYYNSIGYNETYKLFMVSVNNTDYTHFTEKGAQQIARLVAQGVKEANLDIAKYLKTN